jgi:hypothetical protein
MTTADYILLAVAVCLLCYLLAVMLRAGGSR